MSPGKSTSPPFGGGRDGAPKRLAGLIARRAPARAEEIARYSAFVLAMRYALPITAVFLLGLVVVWPLVSGRQDGFRVTYASISQVDGSLRMINARYMGTDTGGRPYTITAAEAIQDENDEERVTLKTIAGDTFLEGGSWTTVTANEGLYVRAANTLDLKGNVSVYSDKGHELHTEEATLNLNDGTGMGNRPVHGQGPLGLIEGDRFTVSEGGATLLLNGNVKATIFPQGEAGKNKP